MYKIYFLGGLCFCNLNPGSGPVCCGVVCCAPPPPNAAAIIVCAVCLYVLQVRAASTVTSWSNQTPTALPNVPPPLQVGSAPDHQVH